MNLALRCPPTRHSLAGNEALGCPTPPTAPARRGGDFAPRVVWAFIAAGVMAVLLACPATARADDAFERLLQLEARYTELRGNARYRDALPLAQQMLAIAERDLAERPELTAVSLENLAWIHNALGQSAEAERLYQRSLPILERLYGREHPLVADSLNSLANVYFSQRRYGDAIDLYRKMLAIHQQAAGDKSPGVALAEHNLGGVYMELGRYQEAEASYRRALAIREAAPGPITPETAETLNNLGILIFSQGRYPEAETLLQRALAAFQQLLPPQHPRIADALNNLGNLCLYEGRFAQAETYYQRSLTMRRATLGADHQDVGQSLNNLGIVCFDQFRLTEAEKYYQQALATRARALGNDHPVVGDTLGNLANLYESQRRQKDAEAAYQRALAIYRKSLPAEHPRIALVLGNLAVVYQQTGRFDEAAATNRQALAISEKVYGADHPDVAQVIHNMAVAQLRAGHFAAALPLITRAIESRDRLRVSSAQRSASYLTRAEIHWELKQQAEALADLVRAIELAEQQRSQTSGGEQERSTSSEQLFLPFEVMARWQTELGDFAAAFAALERGRARSLVDQLHTQGIDLLADVPLDQAQELRRRDSAAKQQVASVEKQLELLSGDASLAPPQQAERESQLLRELQGAQEEAVAVYREMRNLSPAYRLAVSRDFRPLALDDLQAWVSAQRALLLEYAIGTRSSHVVLIPPEGAARVEKLVVPDDLAAALHVEPGELTAEKLAAIWQVGDKDLVERVAEPQLAKTTAERLALLWRLLVPAAARDALVGSTQLERLIIIPDGQLNALPFEALIVEPGAEAKYLLDVAPPISYAASATVLVNLAQRTLKATPSPQPLLTVADAVYGAAAGEAGDPSLVPTARSRYWDGAGPLTALPFTATESSWVVKNFKTEGIPAAGLRGALATEANVRANVAGREFLHFACHGLVDQRYGNFFGALALTPGRRGGPEDDGYLTLPEIYSLPLAGCELAILSACQTNVGPQQRGEGLFGLSRGFLVAGSRRVVASNWLVDDEAAASLVSYFTAGLAQDKKKGVAVDHARALHTAKRWVRAQPKWQSPYYWGTFVLVGPN